MCFIWQYTIRIPFIINKESKYYFVCLKCTVELYKVVILHFANDFMILHVLYDIFINILTRKVIKINLIYSQFQNMKLTACILEYVKSYLHSPVHYYGMVLSNLYLYNNFGILMKCIGFAVT
jgi:hypothetical protein